MRERRALLQVPGLGVHRVRCAAHDSRWSAEESVETLGLVLCSEGVFKRRADGFEHMADAVTAYVQLPGQTQQVAHPAGPDVCTVIVPSEPILGSLGERWRQGRALLLISPAVDLAHRVFLARARNGADEFELAERSAVLLGDILEQNRLAQAAVPSDLDRQLAGRVREAIGTDHGTTLSDLARETGFQAYRLSRAFRRVTGLTITRYRSQLRVRHALARLADGDRSLAGIAADVGFADQAHLTRTLRVSAKMTPRALRDLLSPASGADNAG